MKALLLIVMFGFAAMSSSGIGTYDELVSAAIWLAEHNRTAEIVGLTNSLPSSAIGIFLDEIK